MKPKTNKTKKIYLNILGDSMLNGIQQKWLRKNADEFTQGSIIGPMLFNLFINHLIFFIQETEVCNFADDTTIYLCSPNFGEATLKLSNDMHLILNWFRINSMVANPGKFQIMFLGSNITLMIKLHL